MSATYYHYTVWVEESDDEDSGETVRQDPRDTLDRPFLPDRDTDGSDKEDDSTEEDSDGSDEEENGTEEDEAGSDTFGDVVERLSDGDDNEYIVAFESVYTNNDTISEAYYGKVQRKYPVSEQEGEDGESLVPLEENVEDSLEDGSVAPRDFRSARTGFLYGDDCIHVLIESRPGLPGIGKIQIYLTQQLENSEKHTVSY